MRCYNCGFEAEGDVCPNCGAPLRTYRIIMEYSAAYYNEGLERARARDLSGASRFLEMSLKLDKNSIDARNLLGLIYYETGETVGAITQWVISKNLQSDGNPVDAYLNELRSHPDRLETMNRAIKKYNFSLRNIRKKHYDAARIQLKKVLQLSPKLLRARQLLALLYIQREDYARAHYELMQCARIDSCNEITSRLQREIDKVITHRATAQEDTQSKSKKSQAVAYLSGNETIIQPAGSWLTTGGAVSLISVFLGLVLGVAAMYFLVLPDRIKDARLESNEQIAAISEELDSRAADISEYKQTIETLTQELDSANVTLGVYAAADEGGGVVSILSSAAALYLSDEYEVEAMAELMQNINLDVAEALQVNEYVALYDALVAACGEDLSAYYFTQGARAMQVSALEEAVRLYGLSAQYDPENATALYNYAESTALLGNTDEARLIFNQVVERFPGTSEASDAQTRIIELNQ